MIQKCLTSRRKSTTTTTTTTPHSSVDRSVGGMSNRVLFSRHQSAFASHTCLAAPSSAGPGILVPNLPRTIFRPWTCHGVNTMLRWIIHGLVVSVWENLWMNPTNAVWLISHTGGEALQLNSTNLRNYWRFLVFLVTEWERGKKLCLFIHSISLQSRWKMLARRWWWWWS